MRTCITIATLLACVLTASHARADQILAVANEGIFTRAPDLSDPGTNAQWCNFNPGSGATVGGMMMLQFDLTPYAGKLVDGDAQVEIYPHYSQPGFFFTFGSHAILSNWAEGVSSWATFVGPTTDNTYLATIGGMMDEQTIDAAGHYFWTVSNNVVQNWIDTPADNKGVALVGAGNICVWTRQATWRPVADRPNLTLQIQSLNLPPNTPTNLTPAVGTMRVPRAAPLSASAFSDPDGDGQAASQWQVATDPGFDPGRIAWDSGRDTLNMTSACCPHAQSEPGTPTHSVDTLPAAARGWSQKPHRGGTS